MNGRVFKVRIDDAAGEDERKWTSFFDKELNLFRCLISICNRTMCNIDDIALQAKQTLSRTAVHLTTDTKL